MNLFRDNLASLLQECALWRRRNNRRGYLGLRLPLELSSQSVGDTARQSRLADDAEHP